MYSGGLKQVILWIISIIIKVIIENRAGHLWVDIGLRALRVLIRSFFKIRKKKKIFRKKSMNEGLRFVITGYQFLSSLEKRYLLHSPTSNNLQTTLVYSHRYIGENNY